MAPRSSALSKTDEKKNIYHKLLINESNKIIKPADIFMTIVDYFKKPFIKPSVTQNFQNDSNNSIDENIMNNSSLLFNENSINSEMDLSKSSTSSSVEQLETSFQSDDVSICLNTSSSSSTSLSSSSCSEPDKMNTTTTTDSDYYDNINEDSEDDYDDSDDDNDTIWHTRIKIQKNLGWKIKNEIINTNSFERALEILKSDWTIFYTDASWSDNDSYMGLAWCSPQLNCTKQYQVTSKWTSSQGEAMIINMVLEYIKYENIKKAVICSDSLSSLESLGNLRNSNYADKLIYDMQWWIHLLDKNNQKIELWWCPAHMGIDGNEHADDAAQDARRNGKYIIYNKTGNY